MKTAGEIYDMINSRSGKVWNKKEIAMMVAGVYAQQSCEDLRERIAAYKECFELFMPTDRWDEANAFLSSHGSGLAKELQKNED